jgi:uncharacterized membrane protein YjjP (DUF1212 family)
MTDEMIERVANAIANAMDESFATDCSIAMAETAARAAIEAMRKPTAKMLSMLRMLQVDELAWKVMIDEALK